jgi:hypothetical protein
MAKLEIEFNQQLIESVYNDAMNMEIDGLTLNQWIRACARFREALKQQCYYCAYYQDEKCTNPNGLSNVTDQDFCSRGRFSDTRKLNERKE